MKKIYQVLWIIVLIFLAVEAKAGDNVNLRVTATQLNNGYDCDNDATGICCGCIFSFCDYPEPRWRYRAGYNGANFTGWTLFNGGTRTCGVWDISDYNFYNQNVGSATNFNIDAETWEEDGFGICGSHDDQYDPDNWCGFGLDGDDVHWGPARLVDLYFRGTPPCTNYDWGWYYTGSPGYGVRLQSYYEWANAPTFTVSPTANGSTFTVCPGIPMSFTAATNTSDGWDVGQYFQWQYWTGAAWSSSGMPASPTLSFTATNATGSTLTTIYRLIVTSNCTADFSSKTLISSQITVNVLPAASCFGSSCNTYFVDPVNGNDANPSSPNTPWKTLQKALSVIGNNNSTSYVIKIAKGTTVEPGLPIIMQSNVLVEGGYIAGSGNTDWKKSSDPADKTTIGINYNWAFGAGRAGIIAGYTGASANTANTCNNWRLQDLTISVPSSGNSAYSTFGVYINGCSNYDITRCDISCGAATSGGSGSYGVYVNAGGSGGNILDSKITTTSGVGNAWAVANQGGGTAPSISLPNTGGTVPTVNSTQSTGGTVNNPTNTTLLSGTVRSSSPGRYCVNSEIDMTKASGNWASFPQTTSGVGNLSLVEDLKSGSTSYSTSSGTVKVVASASGAYNIGVNSGTMSKFLTVASTSEYNRTWPVISASPTSICVGASVNLSITSGSFDAGNIAEREWKVYTDAQGPNSAAFTVSSPVATAPSIGPFNTAGTYNVRYRERHNCCGWSKPSFTTITVVADPTTPTITRDPSSASICLGGQVRANITVPTDGINCSNSLQYSIDNGAWQTYTNNTYIGSTALTSIRIRAVRDCSTGPGCTPSVSAEEQWLVVPQPSIFVQPAALNVCSGGNGTLTISVINGVSPQYQWQTATSCGSSFSNAGTNSPAYSTPTSTIGTNYYKVIVTGPTGTGCNTLTSNCVGVTVVDDPGSGPVTGNPNTTTICSGTSVSASFGSGTNGVGCSDIQQFSYDGSGSWNTYSGAISTSGHTSLQIRNYRGNCSSTAGCDDATPNVISYTIVPPPSSGTLTKSPNVASVCHGTVLSVTLTTPGSDGVSCSDIIQYRTKTAGVWSAWNTGSSVTSTSSMTDVEMRTYRGNCNALSGCSDATPNVVSWVINAQPTLSDPAISNSAQICVGGSVTLNSTISGGVANNTPRWEYYNGSSWSKITNGTPTGVTYTDTTGNITLSGFSNAGTYQYRYYLPVNDFNCSAISDTVKVVVIPTMNPGAISTSGQTICSGTSVSAISMSSVPSGANGTYNYQWYQTTNMSASCPATGTPLGSLSSDWTVVSGGTGGTTTSYTPPALTDTFMYLLMVDPTGYPDCGSYIKSSGCYTVTTLPAIDKGEVTGIDSICGSAGDPSPFTFLTMPSGAEGTFQYQWYYMDGDVSPPAGGSSPGTWTSIPGATSANYDPDPPAGAWTTRSYACMVDATGSNDCDGPNFYQWATGRHLVTIYNTPQGGAILTGPISLCNNDPGLITQVSPPVGPTGSTFGYRWYKRTSNTAACPTTTAGLGWALIANSNNTSYDPPPLTGATEDSAVYVRIDSIKTTCSTVFRATNCVKVYRNRPDSSALYPLSSISTSQTRSIGADNVWHNFYNNNCELIASVKSNNQNLGNVTVGVDVSANYHTHGNGGLGHNMDCYNKPELSMGRYYTLTFSNNPSSNVSVRLYYNYIAGNSSTDYVKYQNAILALPYVSAYQFCYGYPNSPGDLVVSRDETTDVAKLDGFVSPSPSPQVFWAEISLTPSQLQRVRNPDGTTTANASHTFRFHTDGGIGEPLPVELISFVGWNEQSVNKLQWITASEQNSSKFIVEKSSIATGNWNYLGEMPAAGNSTTQLTYNFTDENPLSGNNYYRLKLVDIDGRFEYSNIINIPIYKGAKNAFIGLYPNPTDGLLNIDIQSIGKFSTDLKVYDVLGQLINTQPVSLNIGLNRLQLDYTGLARASYILSFTDNEGTQHQIKFIKD